MKRFGLIGNPLTHSFSKKYFEEKFQREGIAGCVYDLFELKSIQELPSLLKECPGLKGLNVTIPYKQSVINYLDDITPEAKEIGAVNCVTVSEGKLFGYNADVYGFETSLVKLLNGKEVFAFVLGTGGSSKAVQFVLNKLKIAYKLVSRNSDSNTIQYTVIDSYMRESNLIINTTPVGMFPITSAFPAIPYGKLTINDFLFDLIYNPAETEFLKRGKQQGAKTMNGLEMLELQAEKSWEIWNENNLLS